MHRKKLIYNPEDWISFGQTWVRPIISEYFDLVPFDPNQTYSPRDSAVLLTYVEQQTQSWFTKLTQSGLKLVVDHLWDSDVDARTVVDNQVMVMRNPNWLWYYSCIEWQWHQYDQYVRSADISRAFFMPMNRQEWHRDQLIDSLSGVLDHALYSYQAQGKHLENDTELNGPVAWRSYFCPDWYNSTCFSVVAESYMRSSRWQQNPHDPYQVYKTEVSEKIFKPMLGQQPFVVFGSVDSLKYLHREGFETFDNLFDETYDTIIDDIDRHHATSAIVIDAVAQWKNGELFQDPFTKQRIQHNHARLFDRTLVNQRFVDEIINPILQFIE